MLRSQTDDQLIRVDATTLDTIYVRTQDRICKPAPSPDGRLVAFAAGPNCNEVWVADSNGAEPRQLTANVGGSQSFVTGVFSWSLDNKVISHASCTSLETGNSCGGAYWDIPLDGTSPRARADVKSVVRETRRLLKPIKLEIDMTGPIEYFGEMLLSNEFDSNLFRVPSNLIVAARASDQDDETKTFELKLLLKQDNRWVNGTIRVVDPSAGFDESMLFFGQVLVQSFRFATVRGVWMQTDSVPLKSGLLDFTLYR